MVENKFALLTMAALLSSFFYVGPLAYAQPVASAPSAASQKEARKAQRKAARAKKNAELKELEKQGYQPGGAQPTYPQMYKTRSAQSPS